MKCKDVKSKTAKESEIASLEDDLSEIRSHLHQSPIPMPPDEFFEHTRALCHARLARPPIPKSIWMAFGALLILSGILMSPLARDVSLEQPLSFPTIGVLILLLQNLLMLFFTPVLIQKFRFRKKDRIDGFIDKEVCHG
jgi:hypothetical protein